MGGDPPELRSPVLVAAFAGWNDAASAATTALEAIAGSLDAEPSPRSTRRSSTTSRSTRPTIRLTEGQTREVDWPATRSSPPGARRAERDLVLVSGIEPNLRWRTFAEAVLDVAERLEVEMVVTLGALLADVAHTRPVPITGLASDPELVERSAFSRSNYEGPTGIVGVLHDACRRRGLTSASLWAAVPHYVAAVPNPKAALALLRRLEGFTGIAIEASELEEAMERFETPGRPRGRLEPGDRGARPAARGRAGRRRRARRGRPLGRLDRPRLPALPAPAVGRARGTGRGVGDRGSRASSIRRQHRVSSRPGTALCSRSGSSIATWSARASAPTGESRSPPIRHTAATHVLDIGCGLPDTTVLLAELVGPAGHAHAVDVAQRMIHTAIDAARRGRARAHSSCSRLKASQSSVYLRRSGARTAVFASAAGALRSSRVSSRSRFEALELCVSDV